MSDRATTRRAPPDAGFTLIEMIVALALMSLIVGLLASSVRGTRQVLAFIDRNNVTGAVPPAQSYLLSSFAQTVSAQQAGADRPPALLGEPARVRFTTSHAPQGQIEGLYHVELRLEPMSGRSPPFDLVAIHTLARPAQADGEDLPAPSRRSILASNVVAASFEYYGTVDGEPDQWRWLDSWSSADRLPRLVRIDVRFAPGQPQTWRRLEFPLQLAD